MESDKKSGIAAANKNFFQSGFTKIQTNIMETMGWVNPRQSAR